ncbi:hypothetical protein BH24ACT4_BH24ACT4_21140 [soil metagenome]
MRARHGSALAAPWKVAAMVAAAIVISAAGCESCIPTNHEGGAVNVNNQTDEVIVVEYEIARRSGGDNVQEVLRLDAGEHGSFQPFPDDGNCLVAPVVVRAESDGRVFDQAEAGECFDFGLDLVARD